jgi:hypothetical protein
MFLIYVQKVGYVAWNIWTAILKEFTWVGSLWLQIIGIMIIRGDDHAIIAENVHIVYIHIYMKSWSKF